MKALSTLRSAIDQSSTIGIIALLSLCPGLLPNIALAAELQTQGQQSAQIFKINISDSGVLEPTLKTNTEQNSISLDDIIQSDPLEASLHNYLVSYNSPLADYTVPLLKHDNWKTVIAISFVESNMCTHALRGNCSGIGGPGHFMRFDDFGQWADYMSNLLATRYNGWSLEKMDSVYVQPYSYNWLLGSKKIYAELTVLEKQAQAEKQASLIKHDSELAVLPTFAENTN